MAALTRSWFAGSAIAVRAPGDRCGSSINLHSTACVSDSSLPTAPRAGLAAFNDIEGHKPRNRFSGAGNYDLPAG